MRRLVINPGTANAWEIPLRDGLFLLGSGAENDGVIEHPSVSGTHCQMTVMNSGVVIKDLGSATGVFVDGKAVQESLLLPGQIVRLGDIELCLESVAQPVKVLTPISPSPPKGLPLEEKGFFACIPEAFAYPCKGNGLVLLISGTIFFGVAGAARSFTGWLGPYGFVIGLGIGVFVTGYLFNYAKSIITSTANGEAAPPNWPDFTEWQEDIAEPFFQLAGLVVLYFGPAIILQWWHPAGPAWAGVISLAAIGLGALLAPMGVMALAML
ncbi:MAG TPA: FHA domain-containing protein, partial [Verrucomicrobiae bacterium]